MQSIVMLSVIYKPFCAECRYAECRSAMFLPYLQILDFSERLVGDEHSTSLIDQSVSDEGKKLNY